MEKCQREQDGSAVFESAYRDIGAAGDARNVARAIDGSEVVEGSGKNIQTRKQQESHLLLLNLLLNLLAATHHWASLALLEANQSAWPWVCSDEKTKDLLRKLYNFFMMEKGMKRPWVLQNPMRRLVKATGIKQSTLRQYINGNDPVQDVVKSIHKAYVQKTVSKTQKVDDFDKGVVRRTIYDLHKKSQSVTMPKLQEALKKKDIDISISTVSRTVHLLGFR
ncbi:unnamed protein product [Mytilus coruscus]|uniref:Uncharacterized protein n=1 Tax=Mytilus coruscus TaxID=42192 RepID=A0A6J8BDI3_MYTCO|nr:unnamed protein product [Mytilus coruscus]